MNLLNWRCCLCFRDSILVDQSSLFDEKLELVGKIESSQYFFRELLNSVERKSRAVLSFLWNLALGLLYRVDCHIVSCLVRQDFDCLLELKIYLFQNCKINMLSFLKILLSQKND
ncbi:hypothetical protein BpHYR1_044067 [Brachionus plicatilis]|uniref:Uncharacterized protein n=1 Tax=Brachionus plicatilis TaxID=10195 RepID=A0A3M7Q8D8_BRAPC|nr:hypothetical protein BpHYR1_044067 [Brachionus plicatilis]